MVSSNPTQFGNRSKNSYILNSPEYSLFSSYILKQALCFGNDNLGYDYEEYKITQSWVSTKHPNEGHIEHQHPNSLISGVFYFGDITPHTPCISFLKSRSYLNQNIISPRSNNKPPTPYTYTSFDLKVHPGLLVLFPSWLHHSVPINTSNKVRYSLSFNIVPLGGLGDEWELTEMRF